MRATFQEIKTKVAGLPCEIQICNHQGHGVLTTYDPAVNDTVAAAQDDLVKFWDDCIKDFNDNRSDGYGRSGLKPIVNGRRPGSVENEMIDPSAPDFDLSLFEQVTVMPFPLVGG